MSPVPWLPARRPAALAIHDDQDQLPRISLSARIIQHAIWLYVRFTLSFRDIEKLWRSAGSWCPRRDGARWVNHFGPAIAANLRKRRFKPRTIWQPPNSSYAGAAMPRHTHPAVNGARARREQRCAGCVVTLIVRQRDGAVECVRGRARNRAAQAPSPRSPAVSTLPGLRVSSRNRPSTRCPAFQSGLTWADILSLRKISESSSSAENFQVGPAASACPACAA